MRTCYILEMEQKDKQLTANFKLSEFEYVEPDPRLITLLQMAREDLKLPIIITRGPSSPIDHLNIYHGRAPFDIPWGSRHLPCFHNPYLRAADIQVQQPGGYKTGQELKELMLKLRDTPYYMGKFHRVFLGLGAGKTFLHIDIDRKEDTFWGYD